MKITPEMNSLPNKTLSFRLLLHSLIDYDRTFTLEGFMKPKKQIIPEKRASSSFHEAQKSDYPGKWFS
jgi:hypothetical protein